MSSGGFFACRRPHIRSSWLVESTTLCTPSVSIAEEPVIVAATNLDTAMPRFAANAMTRVRVLAVGALISAVSLSGARSLHQLPALDHCINMLEQSDIAKRVAVHGDHVAVASRLDHADVVAPQSLGGARSGGADRLDRRHAPLHHLGELPAVLPVRIDSGVGAEDHLHPRADCPAESLALLAADHPLLVEALLLGAVRGTGREDVVVVVDVHVEPGAVLLGQLDGRVAGEACMFDGVDSGEDRIVDPLIAVRMRRDLHPEHMRLVGDRLHFGIAELLCANAVAQ